MAATAPSDACPALGEMNLAGPSSELAGQTPSALTDDTIIEVIVKTKTPRQRCARCVRKELKCKADTTTPGGRFCQSCTKGGVLCFFHDPDDATLRVPLVDETSTEAYKALATLHLDFLDQHWYNGDLHDAAKRADALERPSSSGDKNAKNANAREAVGYVLDASWFFDLFGQTMRFIMGVDAFIEASTEAKKAADIERANAKRRTIIEGIKKLKFWFDNEDEYEPEHVPRGPLDPTGRLTPPVPVKEEKYEFKIDVDTADLMFTTYTCYMKLFNLLASNIERVIKQHGPSALIKVRGDEHENLNDSYNDDEEAAETTHWSKRNKGKKNKAKAMKEKKVQNVPAKDVVRLVVDRFGVLRPAFDKAVDALEKEDSKKVKALQDMDDKAGERWLRLVNKVAKD